MIFQNKYNCKIEDLKRKSINSLCGCEVWQSWQRWLQDDTRRATLLQECTIRATLLQFWACHCAHRKAAGVGLWPTKLVMTSGLTTDCSVLPVSPLTAAHLLGFTNTNAANTPLVVVSREAAMAEVGRGKREREMSKHEQWDAQSVLS